MALDKQKAMRLLIRYIGVSGGYLGDFSYRTSWASARNTNRNVHYRGGAIGCLEACSGTMCECLSPPVGLILRKGAQ